MGHVDANRSCLTPDRANTERRFGTTKFDHSSRGVLYQDIACFSATTFPVRVQLAASFPALPPLFSGVAGPVLPKNMS